MTKSYLGFEHQITPSSEIWTDDHGSAIDLDDSEHALLEIKSDTCDLMTSSQGLIR